jgi:hypothetical protein
MKTKSDFDLRLDIHFEAKVLKIGRDGATMHVEAKAVDGDWHHTMSGPVAVFPKGLRRGEVVMLTDNLNHVQLGLPRNGTIRRLTDIERAKMAKGESPK